MRRFLISLFFLATHIIVQTDAQSSDVMPQCLVVPSPGRCRQNQNRRFWSYSSKVGGCTQLFGCYGIRDRNVFLSKRGCERNCFRSGGSTPRPSPMECDVNPSPGRCPANEQRRFWSYSSKIRSCVQITGCYTLSDRNVFLTRLACRRNCVISRPGRPATKPVPLPGVLPTVPDTLPPIIVNLNNSATTLPVEVPYKVDTECRVNPSAGVCRPNEQREYFTYSSKTGTCVKIFGCYSIRDRNVFLSRDTCRQECLNSGGGNGGEWAKDAQCYINPTPGRCDINPNKAYWTFSSKTDACTQVFGCFSVRDRNIFLTKDSCDDHCVGNNTAPVTPPDINIKIALECRINPSPGLCTDPDKRSFYTYSGKTGDCIQIFGCYSVRDRNVFLTRADCRRGCFLNEDATTEGSMEAQCYIHPSQGRCTENEKRTYYTYSTKTSTCVQIYGCYGIRDRNVFLTRAGCRQACTGRALGPVTLPTISASNGAQTLPGGKDYSISPECRINPSPDVCPKSQEREYFMFSSKTNSCVRIFGCYSIYDRNVFLTRDGCRRNCYVYDTSTPSGAVDAQCYLNPTPGRCRDSEKRTYYSYSSKTMTCSQLYGCYSIRDRNVFLTGAACQAACTPGRDPVSTTPPIPIDQIAPQCRLTPTPGRCLEQDRRTYFTYSSKTHTCTQIFGCYSIRDRNVFVTRTGCTQNCFTRQPDTGGREAQCYINPAPGNCANSRRRTFYSFSQKTSTCVRIYGCYSVRDRNVFFTRAGCRRRCDNDRPTTTSTADTATNSAIEVSFVDVRGQTDPQTEFNNVVNIRPMDITTANTVDIRPPHPFDFGTMFDIRSGDQMTDIRNDAGGVVPGASMVDIRRGSSSGGIQMVDIRTADQTRPDQPALIDIRDPSMVDIRNGQGTMVDIRNGVNVIDGSGSRGMVDIRSDNRMTDIRSGNNMVDIRGQNGNMVDIRGQNGNMVDIRGQNGNMVDIRGGQKVDIRSGQNMVDIRGGRTVDIRNEGNMVDIRGVRKVDIRGDTATGNRVDIRGGRMVDIRSDGSKVDIRGGRKVDIRGEGTPGNMVDIRGGQMVDIRGNFNDRAMTDIRADNSMVDIRDGSPMVNIRDGTGSNMVDIRGRNLVDIRGSNSPNRVDIRGGNKVDIRGANRVDIRGDQTSGNMVDIRGGQAGMVDIRNDGTMVDIRGGKAGGKMVDIRGGDMVDIRGGKGGAGMVDIRSDGTMVDIRGGKAAGGFVDIRNGNMVDIRGDRAGGKMVDIRGDGSMVDIRGDRTGGKMVDIRNGNMVDIRGDRANGNMVDIRGNGRSGMVDIRSDGSMVDIRGGGTTSGNMVDIRNGNTGKNMVDIRSGGSMTDIRGDLAGNNMVDIRGGQASMVDIRGDGTMVDIRGGEADGKIVDIRGNNMVDIRGGNINGKMVDIRSDGTMVDIRGGKAGGKMVDIRAGNMVDIRGGKGGAGMVDIRRHGSGNMIDIRGGSGGFVDIRGNETGNMVDIRGDGTNSGFVDIRDSNNMVDIRGDGISFVDIREANNPNMVDIRRTGNKVDIRNTGEPGGTMVDIRKDNSLVDIRDSTSANNMVDIRGNAGMVDIRGDTSPGMVDIRGQGNMVDIRGNKMVDIRGKTNSGSITDIRGNKMVDIRGNTNMVDIRDSSSGTMVDIRGGNNNGGNMVDIRGGNMVDIRGGNDNMVDIRTDGPNNMVDIRGNGTSGSMVDIRGQAGMIDIRGGSSGSGMVDIRGSGKMVDIRDGLSNNMVDIRGGSGNSMVDIRNGKMVDIRGGTSSNNMVDIRNGLRNLVDIRNGNSNMVDIRGNGQMVDIRQDGANNMVDIRGDGTSSNMVDIRGGNSGNMVDIRGGNMVDIRGGNKVDIRGNTMVDIRDGSSSNMVDIRDGTSSNMIDIRGGGSNMVDIRGNGLNGMVDIRNGGMVDIRNNNNKMVDIRDNTNNMVDIRGHGTANMVDIRNDGSGNMVDIRGNSRVDIRNQGNNMVDIRQGGNKVDIRGGNLVDIRGGNMVDIRGNNGGNMVDIRRDAAGNMVDIRTDASGNMIDIRGQGNMVDIRDANGNLVDIRNQGGNFVDIRGDNMVDIRNQSGNMVDIRGPNGNMVDIRQNSNMVDIRNDRGNMVDIRGQNGNMVDIRGPNGNMVDIRNGNMVDIRNGNMVDIRNGNLVDIRNGNMVDIRGNNGNMVDIRGNNGNMVDVRGTNGNMVDIRGTNGNMVDIRGNNANMVDIRDANGNLVDIRNQGGMVDIRGNSNFVDIRNGGQGTVDASMTIYDPSRDITSLTDLPIINVGRGIRIARECLINPTPGICLENQRKTFWTFSTKTNSCTRITGCFDIHDRNTWLTMDGCRANCFKNDSVEEPMGVLPLECQLNPTPGRCLASEERTVWVYNTKLAACTELTGCYDFHDRNVWSSRDRCRTKCRLMSAIVAPEIPYDVKGITIAQECHLNPSPGRCLESEQKTFWTFSSKTSACTRITGCYNIRDRNTWLTRASCQRGCIINETDVVIGRPLECKLVPSPGRCLESQKKSVWTYSDKLGICVELTGCYDFHDRNVWRTQRDCDRRCQVKSTPIPDLTDYDIALQCQLTPSPGRCTESEKRTFYSYSSKVGGCVEIYGCYTINDRNVWYTRNGCRRSCLIPHPGTEVTPDFVAPGCLRPPLEYPCRPRQRTSWFTYDINTGACVQRTGCYRLGDRNVFVNKRRCEVNCFGRRPDDVVDGIARECKLNPTPGVCRDDERQSYWSYSQKTGTCVQITGCYTIRDRNVWLSRTMCRNNCIRKEQETRSSVLPNFLADANRNGRTLTITETNNAEMKRGRRGKLMTRNSNPEPVPTDTPVTTGSVTSVVGGGGVGGSGSGTAGDIVVSDIFTTIEFETPVSAGMATRPAVGRGMNGNFNTGTSNSIMPLFMSGK